MNRIDFTKAGGFPLTQDTLAFMQSDYVRALNGLAATWAVSQGDAQYLILSGCVFSSGTYSPGICAVNGEILYFVGGNASFMDVRIVEITQEATFEDGNVYPVYITRILEPKYDPYDPDQGEGVFVWSDFKRVSRTATYEQGTRADSAVQSATIGGVAVPESGGILRIPAYPTSLPANGGNADTLENKRASDFVPFDMSILDVTQDMFVEDLNSTIWQFASLKLINRIWLQGYINVQISEFLSADYWSVRIKEAFHPASDMITLYQGVGIFSMRVFGGDIRPITDDIPVGNFYCPINWLLQTPYPV
jgi:hypothetical protein